MKKNRMASWGLLGLLLALHQVVFSQEYILKVNKTPQVFECENIRLANDMLEFDETNSGDHYQVSVDQIYNIQFRPGESDLVSMQSIVIDTIVCQIDSIGEQIFYRDEAQVLKTISRHDVFGVFFSEAAMADALASYAPIFTLLHRSNSPLQLALKKKGGETVAVKPPLTIDGEKASFTLNKNGVDMDVYKNLDQLEGIFLREPSRRQYLWSGHIYVETATRWTEVPLLYTRSDKMILRVMRDRDYWDMVPQPKESIEGIFFYDYKGAAEKPSEVLVGMVPMAGESKVKLDVNGGIGYWLASLPDGLSADEEEYYNGLRVGYTLEANLNYLTPSGFGFGAKYNRFYTNNTYKNVLEDKIYVNFIGVNFMGYQAFRNQKGYYYSGIALGYMTERYEETVQSVLYEIKGHTVGYCVAFGTDFEIAKNVYLGLQCDMMFGSINEFEYEGQKIELDDPESLWRLDALLGLKFYF